MVCAGRLHGRVAAVTGGASGIGQATVMRLLREGASVVVGDIGDATRTLQLAAEHSAADRVRAVTTDVAREADVVRLMETASDLGPVSIVVNNAGILGTLAGVTDIEVEDWDVTFSVLCRGVFLGIKHGARAMQQAGRGGSIVNVASVAGLLGSGGPLTYSAAKAAVLNLTKTSAVQLAANGIRVNAVCPGGINTPMVNMGMEPKTFDDFLRTLQPLAVPGNPDFIASAIAFLASDDAAFVTGEAVVVDGGTSIVGPFRDAPTLPPELVS